MPQCLVIAALPDFGRRNIEETTSSPTGKISLGDEWMLNPVGRIAVAQIVLDDTLAHDWLDTLQGAITRSAKYGVVCVYAHGSIFGPGLVRRPEGVRPIPLGSFFNFKVATNRDADFCMAHIHAGSDPEDLVGLMRCRMPVLVTRYDLRGHPTVRYDEDALSPSATLADVRTFYGDYLKALLGALNTPPCVEVGLGCISNFP